MALSNTVLSSPKAVIMIGGNPAGYIRNLTCNESIQRVDVKGLGNFTTQQRPATGHTGTWSCDFFFIDFNQPALKEMINRYGTLEAFKDTLVLGEFPFSISIFKKKMATSDATLKLVTSVGQDEILTINECYIDSQNFTIGEGSVSSLSCSGSFLQPITLKP